MIIGKGSLAKMLNDREGAIFFASGESDSQIKEEEDYGFSREILLLHKIIYYTDYCDTHSFFYFSTISVNFLNTPYTRHKLKMEKLIKNNVPNYNIIRLGNIWECTNPNTFRNYIKAHPEAEIRDEWKYMIHKEQLLLLTNNLPLVGKHEISVFGEMKKVKDCL